MLEIMLRNLVDNALRYCPAGSRVEIEADAPRQARRIAVRDDGPGVDEASRKRLTERFFRVLGQGQGGSGLGAVDRQAHRRPARDDPCVSAPVWTVAAWACRSTCRGP
jgi:signal transduction histidine kinase